MLRFGADMLHNKLITEFPCSGELVRVEERCTRWLTVLRCSGCATEISFQPDSTWVEIVAGDESGVVGVGELMRTALEIRAVF
jgi:hypothetical protein